MLFRFMNKILITIIVNIIGINEKKMSTYANIYFKYDERLICQWKNNDLIQCKVMVYSRRKVQENKMTFNFKQNE